ncbi:MAG: hypothetical protein N2376_12545 [Clostridia bacterium]|nr:hypothetical protein [Clostridia bacterium]
MKRLLTMVILSVLLVSGCGPAKTTRKDIPKKVQEFSDSFKTVKEYPISKDMVDLLYLNSLNEPEVMTPTPNTPLPSMSPEDALGAMFGNPEWPAQNVSPDMPPYPKGKMTGWNTWGGDENSIFILIDGTSKDDLEAYTKELEKNGFYEDNGRYVKGVYSIEFQWNSDTILQISSYKEKVLSWPEDILKFVPPLEKGYLTNVNAPAEDNPYGDLYFIGLTEEDIKAWEEVLKNEGFTVDSGTYSKENVKSGGKSYKHFSAFFESNGTNEWILYFEFSNE